jgi:hypothetical protein
MGVFGRIWSLAVNKRSNDRATVALEIERVCDMAELQNKNLSVLLYFQSTSPYSNRRRPERWRRPSRDTLNRVRRYRRGQ